MEILYLLVAGLKILGIIILGLLALLLLLIVIILIVPIKYDGYLNKTETIDVFTNIKWLYSIVSVDIIYSSQDGFKKAFKLFGIRLSSRKTKEKTATKTKTTKEKKKTKDKDQISFKNKKAPPTEKVKEIKQDQARKILKKKSNLKENIKLIQSFRYKKELIEDTIKWMGQIIKSIGPDYLDIYIEFGKEDPAQTGQIMALLWGLYPYYYPTINIVGNYEKECFYGKIKARGQVTIVRFILDFIKYIRTRSVKELIKTIRKNRKGKKDGRKIAN